MVYLYRLILLCLFSVGVSHAADGPVPKELVYSWSFGSYSGSSGSLQGACSAGMGLIQSLQQSACSGSSSCSYSTTSPPPLGCTVIRNGNTAYQVSVSSSQVCPVHSQPVGDQCFCSPGFIQVGITCQPGNNPDKLACSNFSLIGSLAGGALTQDYRFTGVVADGQQLCTEAPGLSPGKGCKVTFSRDSLLNYGPGKEISEGTISMSPDSMSVDQSCTLGPGENPSPTPPKENCSTGYTGVVNGVEVCINKVPDSGVDGGKTDSETDDGNETKKVTIDRNTTCENGVCTTTTTTTTTTTNNTTSTSNTSTSTNTTSQSQAGFCAENPSSRLCKDGTEDGSDFQGPCSSGFICEGDAIQCAIAQEQHRRACKLFDDKNSESELYENNKGKEGNQTADLPGNETISLAGRIDTSDALGGGSCIGDLNVTVWGSAVTLPLSNLCQYLAMLGNILVAVSLLMAARIVTRG